VVKGFAALLDELERARDFAGVQAAGIHYGERIGPTLARIVVMIATYGVAKFAGLFKGGALSLPGGSRAAALAEEQGLRLPAAESAQSIALAPDGSVVIDLGSSMAMAGAEHGGSGPAQSRDATSKEVKDTLRLKAPRSGIGGKEGAKDVPSWVRGERPRVDEKYGPNNWKEGPGTEFNKIRKWGDRAFEDPGEETR